MTLDDVLSEARISLRAALFSLPSDGPTNSMFDIPNAIEQINRASTLIKFYQKEMSK